jgi:hypothetical protein
LHIATQFGQQEAVKLLIREGADKNARNQDNQTPLHLAACYNVEPVIPQFLIGAGASLDPIDRWKWTPLFWACYRDHYLTFQELIKGGAQKDIRDNSGKTPADWARERQSKRILDLLRSQKTTYPPTGQSQGKESMPESHNSSACSGSQKEGTVQNEFYPPPGNLGDLRNIPDAGAKWSDTVDGVFEKIICNKQKDKKEANFYNAARENTRNATTPSVKWSAFPGNLDDDSNRWELADKRENQDEYCEWEVKRKNGHLKCVSFTTELPEVHTIPMLKVKKAHNSTYVDKKPFGVQ